MLERGSHLLTDKVVVVTGGAGVLGRQFCTAIVKIGGVAIVADRDVEAATRAAAEMKM